MPLTTKQTRSSAISPGCVWRGIWPVPDGTLMTDADRELLLFLYAGLEVAAPVAPTRAKGGRVRFVNEAPKEPERPKPKPKPVVVPEAAALPDLPPAMAPLFGPAFNPELWHRMAQFRVNAPVLSESVPEPPPEAPGDQLMRQLMQAAGTPAFPMLEGDEWLEHFLRMLGNPME